MACVLRVSGKNFNVDKFLKQTKLKYCAIYRMGEPRSKFKPDGKKNEKSGINIAVSDADFYQLDKQISGTIKFLIKHQKELKKLLKYPGVSPISELDFGVAIRDVAIQSDYLPPKLIALAGRLGLGCRMTLYPSKMT